MTDLATLERAKDLAEAGQYADAWRIVSPHLSEEPNDPRGLLLATFMLEKQGNPALAYQLCKQLTQSYPANPICWINLGKCCDTLWRMSEGEAAYMRALNQVRAGDDATKATIYTNLAALFLQLGEFTKASSWSEKALKIDPEHLKSRHNMGLCMLAAGEWAEGWKFYEASVGSPHRIAWNYAGEPTWTGEPGKTVVIFGEQGIGDEICAASMFEDAIERAGKVIIDCDQRLAGLLQRSFPKAKVYGTRTKKVLDWAEEDQDIQASIAAMQLGGIFRTDKAAFHGKPYLVADPDRVLMWRALWERKGKPAIGIAWTGGIKESGRSLRSLTLDQLGPIFDIDATFVSLEYKPHPDDPRVLRFAETGQGRDYDDTAALVASLDAVVGVPTSVIHLAGALGVPTVAMEGLAPCWKYKAGLPFHPRELVQNRGWEKTIEDAAKALRGIVR